MLEFYNTCDINGIMYQRGFHQRLFIDSDIVKPEYEIKEEGYEDGEMNFIRTFQKERKIFKLEWLVYEYMLDSIHTIPLHDNKILYLKNGEKEIIDNLQIEVDWITSGVAKLLLKFTTRYVIKTACCSNLGVIKCLVATHKPVKDIITTQSPIWNRPGTTLVKNNDRYIVTNIVTGYDKIYIYTTLGWQEETSIISDVVVVISNGGTFYYNGKKYLRYPFINSATSPSTKQIKIKGFSLPNTFVQIYFKLFSSPIYTAYPIIYTNEQLSVGVSFSVLYSNLYNIKIHAFNHNCDYGYSPVESVIVT